MTNSVTTWTGLAMSADGSRLTGVFLDGCCFHPGIGSQQAALAPLIDIGGSAGHRNGYLRTACDYVHC